MAKKTQNDLESSDPLQDSGSPEWPCKPTVESSGWPSKWPSITTPSTLQTPLPTPEDEAANKGQLPALLAVSEYLNSTLSLDDDDDDFSDDEDEFQDYDFFVKLFKQDEGLRDYYVKNKENGVFCCLVCCGVREKGWKRFKNCAVLVQHAVSIAKTKKRRAHRAYSQVVCEVLGWDVNKLPSVVISAADESSDELVKAQGDADNGGLSGQCKTLRNTEASLSEESFISESQLGKCGGSSVEWPCNTTIESSGWPSKWPSITTPSKLQTPLPTPEDEAANKGQLQALLAVSEYLNSTLSLDDDDDDFSEDDDGEGCNDYDFFVKLFNQDEGLREYYEKNKESGVFCCLVCCGVREKGWKRFKNCATLVQHAVTVAKTKKRRAHRAYSQVVCEIIGWDFNRLPSIVLSARDKLGEVVAEENAVSKAGADGLLEDLSYTIPETLKGNEEGASNCVEPPKECPVIANEKKDCQKDDDVHKNLQEDVNHELLALTIGDAN